MAVDTDPDASPHDAPPGQADVAALRAFTRAVTQRIGLLQESYLGTGRALGPSRVLFEIDDRGTRVGDLRTALGLDSGYLSRLLRQLERDGLVAVRRDPSDGRQRIVVPTRAGRRQRQLLDRRSEAVAAGLIAPLDARRRAELVAAVTTAERLVRAATVRFTVVDPRSPAAAGALAHYFRELDERFRSGFDAHLGGADDDAAALTAPRGAFVLMTDDRAVIGCGGVRVLDGRTAEIKRMWVDAGWRGLGLGARLLGRLEAECRALGRRRAVLDTNEVLTEAVAMYERAGYRAIERYNDNPYAHHWFEKHLDPA